MAAISARQEENEALAKAIGREVVLQLAAAFAGEAAPSAPGPDDGPDG